MHHRDGGILFKNAINVGSIQQITLFKGAKFHGILPTCGQIIERHRHISCLLQRLAGMRPDVTRTACDKYVFSHRHRLDKY